MVFIASAWATSCAAPRSPPPVSSPPPEPKLERTSERDLFREGEAHFAGGAFARAAEAYQAYLRENPNGPQRAGAMVRLAVLYTMPDETDWKRATLVLNQLMAEHPEGPFRAQAELILRLRAHIDRLEAASRDSEQRARALQRELETLKGLDLEASPRPSP